MRESVPSTPQVGFHGGAGIVPTWSDKPRANARPSAGARQGSCYQDVAGTDVAVDVGRVKGMLVLKREHELRCDGVRLVIAPVPARVSESGDSVDLRVTGDVAEAEKYTSEALVLQVCVKAGYVLGKCKIGGRGQMLQDLALLFESCIEPPFAMHHPCIRYYTQKMH